MELLEAAKYYRELALHGKWPIGLKYNTRLRQCSECKRTGKSIGKIVHTDNCPFGMAEAILDKELP